MVCKNCNKKMYLHNEDNGKFYWECYDCDTQIDIPHKVVEENLNKEIAIIEKYLRATVNDSFANRLDGLEKLGVDMFVYYTNKNNQLCGGESCWSVEEYREKILREVDYTQEISISGYTSWAHIYISVNDQDIQIVSVELRQE